MLLFDLIVFMCSVGPTLDIRGYDNSFDHLVMMHFALYLDKFIIIIIIIIIINKKHV